MAPNYFEYLVHGESFILRRSNLHSGFLKVLYVFEIDYKN
ncbi:MAG: hypothetical protein OFPI_08080 [Osedax symbiont Rs2]|nr:MAG: hypothetical protein OFPI_08080 [Osedax symbiont Rs2]